MVFYSQKFGREIMKYSALIFAFMMLLLIQNPLYAQVEFCLECHDELESTTFPEDYIKKMKGIKKIPFSKSIHQELDCIDCHSQEADYDSEPHFTEYEPVLCGTCHEEEVEIYQLHGRLDVATGEDVPSCADCHGSHGILPSSERESLTNPLHLPASCGVCHEDLGLVKKHEILFEHPVRLFKTSVHGQASLGGVHLAATCNDCHSSGETAHRILGPGHPESAINHFNIPKTCGKCHSNIEKDYWEGTHGKLAARGEVDVPVCTDCHGEHGILPLDDLRSPVSAPRLAEATCSPCHESARLNEKYGTDVGRLRTFIDTYHGLKSKTGDLTVANCASCHGAHRILPSSDASSSIYKDNLQGTCGNCHPNISVVAATTPVHGSPGLTTTPIANLVRIIYIIAIIVIIGLMVIHWLIDLRKQIKSTVMRGEQVKRMTFNEIWQHMFLTLTFVILVITGFSLRFSEADWVQFLFGWEGGFPFRGLLHRIAGVVFIVTVFWHLIYLLSQRGRRFMWDIWPGWRDFQQFGQMIGFNLDLVKEEPRFSRFSYVEKSEYWALVWGTAIMIFSGLFLWFDYLAVKWFPKGFLDVMLVIHYYEAWLATLAIFVWHMYSVVFSPKVYPMNPSWLTGTMPIEQYLQEHPEDPFLKEYLAKRDQGNKDQLNPEEQR